MSGYKLWGRAGWGSTIVEAQLVWYGLPYTFEPVEDLFRTPDAAAKLAKVNPLAQVPTLEMPDGSVMSESAAITLLLADITGQDSLVPPANARERAKFLRWLVFIVANIYPTFTYADDPARFVSVNAARDPFRAATDAYAQRLWKQIEGEAGSPWFLGERFSALDIYARRHDPLAAQARLVRERDAAPLRHRPARRPGARARPGVEAQLAGQLRAAMQRRAFVTLAVGALAHPAWAQGSYPDKPITMVVPAPPGGGTDLIARLYSDLLSQELGQQVIVDNKGGGNGNVGTAIVARARPDGYTLLMQYSAYHSANPALIKELNWKPEDFAGIAMGAVAPHVIVDRQEGAGR